MEQESLKKELRGDPDERLAIETITSANSANALFPATIMGSPATTTVTIRKPLRKPDIAVLVKEEMDKTLPLAQSRDEIMARKDVVTATCQPAYMNAIGA